MAIQTGFKDIDELFDGGLREGDLYLLGARPGMGKTALALSIVNHVCVERRQPCAYFSMDTPEEAIMERMAQVHSRLYLHPGTLCDTDACGREAVIAEIGAAPLRFVYAEHMTASGIAERCRAMNDGHLSLVVVDEIQQISRKKGAACTREIAAGLSALKQLAEELGCPVLILSQISRKADLRRDKHPRIRDFRHIADPEMLADGIMMLYRAGYYDRALYADVSESSGSAELHCVDCVTMEKTVIRLVLNHTFAGFE